MKTHDPLREAARPSDPARPMHETRPALQMDAGRARARATLGVLTLFCGVLAVGAAILLIAELQTGGRGVSEKWGVSFPSWVGLLGGCLVGLAGVRHSYVGWSATGARHGILDQVLEPTGLRLVHRRRLGRRQELLVGRGERLTIAASLEQRSRGGANRSYRFVVSTPSGSFVFTESIWIERLSLALLVPTTRSLGIELVTLGDAKSITLEPPERPGSVPGGR